MVHRGNAVRLIAATGLALALSSAAAWAVSLDAQQLMGQFNVLALGEMNGNPHVEGTAYVGGDLTVAGGFYVNSDNLPAGAVGDVSGALIVGGDIDGAGPFTTAGNGNVVVGGTATIDVKEPLTEGVGINGPGGIAVAAVTNLFETLTADLASLAPSSGSGVDTSDQNNILIKQGTPVGGLSIVDATAGFLSSGGVNQKFGPDFDTSITTIVNIPGTVVTIGANLDGLQFSKVLFNFFEATSVMVNSGVTISMLAPFADVTLGGGGIKGTLVAGSVDQRSEIRPFDNNTLFDGDLPAPVPVPLPAAGLTLLSALGWIAAMRLRVRKTAGSRA